MRLILPIRFHTRIANNPDNFQKQISVETQDFLKSLAVDLSNSATVLENEICDLLPVQSPRLLDVNQLVQGIIRQHAARPDCTELVIDAGGPNFEDMPPPSIAYAVQAAVNHLLNNNENLRVLVTYYSEYDPKDACYSALRSVFENPRAMIFFYRDATIKQSSDITTELSGAAITYSDDARKRTLLMLESVKKSTRDKIREKLVCHIGAFSVPGSDDIIYDYYEGNNASSEVFQEIRDVLEASIEEAGRVINLLYDDTTSKWFARVVNNAVNSMFGQVDSIPFSEHQNSPCDRKIDIVFTPVTRTGAAAQRLIDAIEETIEADTFSIWTLIDIRPVDSPYRSKSVAFSDGREVMIQSIIELGARGEHLNKIWASTELPAVPVSEIDLTAQFRAESMWAMLYEAGISPEDFVPVEHRSSLGTVMNSSTLVEYNRQLLASKVKAILASEYGSLAGKSFTFVHVDQDPAKFLAAALKDISPTNDAIVLDSKLMPFARHSASLDELQSNAAGHSEELGIYCESLIQQLRGLNENYELSQVPKLKVVLLLEFNASGRTMVGMRKFCELMDWEVVTCVAIANMVPDIAAAQKAKHAFYEFGYELPDEVSV